MVKTNLDTGADNLVDRSPVRLATNSAADRIHKGTRHKLDAVVRTSAPEAGKDKPKDGGDKPKDAAEKPKDGAEKPKDKPEEKKPEPKPEEPTVKHLDAASGAAPSKKSWLSSLKSWLPSLSFPAQTGIGITGGLGALAVGGAYPSTLASIPLIGKIPYLVQAAQWLNSGVSSLVSPLGLGTGSQAINTFMAGLPAGVGLGLTGAVAIPTALWLGGLTNSLITGEKYGGFIGNMTEATKTITEAAFWPYNIAMGARNKAGAFAQGTYDTIKKPFVGAWNVASNIAHGAWNATTETTSAALKPTKWGVGGAFLGTTLALSTGAGAAIPILAGAGYAISNYLKNTGAMNGNAATHSAGHGH